MRHLPRLVVAAPGSGHGKTTVAVGLMAALRRRGQAVAGLKVGPDYIDPSYHAVATGRPGRNLDPYLQSPDLLVPLLLHAAATPAPTDIAVVEGVMGLHDGALGREGFASTAHVASLIKAPVLLVVDVSRATRSVAALVHGFATFGHAPRLAGVILNKVGSPSHESEIRQAVATTGIPVLGALRREDTLDTPSRHLGLVPAAERQVAAQRTVHRLGERVAEAVDLDAVVAAARTAPDVAGQSWQAAHALSGRAQPRNEEEPPVVAVASGPAFTFRYPETEELLTAAGMQVVPMDPLRDEDLPRGCAGLYLGGGFPQLYAGDLSANAGLRRRVAQAAASGMPIVAECAGLLYLCQDIDGVPMVGALNARARMTPTLTLGYRHAVAVNDSVVAQAGAAVTGHEFHRTQVEPAHGETPAWRVHRHQQPPAAHGFVSGVGGSIHATFLHLHWAGHPYIAARFATAVRRFAHRKVDSGQLSADLTGSSR